MGTLWRGCEDCCAEPPDASSVQPQNRAPMTFIGGEPFAILKRTQRAAPPPYGLLLSLSHSAMRPKQRSCLHPRNPAAAKSYKMDQKKSGQYYQGMPNFRDDR